MKHIVIADTSGLFSLVSETDRNHAVALAESDRLMKTEGTIIVPSDVFTETLNILGKKSGHTFALQTADILLSEPAFVLLETESQSRHAAIDKLREQKAAVSFTDCLVMAIADRFETKIIFGFDEAFRDNGYTALEDSERSKPMRKIPY